MNWRDVRGGGQFVNLKFLGTKTIKDTIVKVFKQSKFDRENMVATLKNTKRNVSLNATSLELLGEKWGDETDEWVGKKVKVSRQKNTANVGGDFLILVEPDGK